MEQHPTEEPRSGRGRLDSTQLINTIKKPHDIQRGTIQVSPYEQLLARDQAFSAVAEFLPPEEWVELKDTNEAIQTGTTNNPHALTRVFSLQAKAYTLAAEAAQNDTDRAYLLSRANFSQNEAQETPEQQAGYCRQQAFGIGFIPESSWDSLLMARIAGWKKYADVLAPKPKPSIEETERNIRKMLGVPKISEVVKAGINKVKNIGKPPVVTRPPQAPNGK